MSNSRNEETIFRIAAEIASPEARSEYLHQACGKDEALINRLQILLRADDESPRFLESPPPGISLILDQPITEKPGQQIGPYKLREKIGEGGFGVVYVAEQREPVSRKVALKVIKPGMDSKDIIARFEAERQALAMMDHPNVAKALDAGAAETGRPYFIMELVHGVAITDYCDSNKLTNRERLELFIDVCHAVQHAHQKGIIHRDIKPSNVMVTEADHRAVVKVIDFGVAKALHHDLTDKSIYTGYGQMVGTPIYMSPEQAQMSSQDIDTRSDIYSLGVLLYELLTGTTPFDKAAFKKAGFEDVRRMIREIVPRRPSEQVSTLKAEQVSTISDSRSIAQGSLSKSLRGDLDWIVMKTLEKDRSRRYETAIAMADDVQRYLDNELVIASPPSKIYRFRKFALRNRVALAISALIAAGLIIGLVGMGISNYLITQQREAKEEALVTARENEKHAKEKEQEAAAALAIAASNSERAEQNLDKTLDAVERLLIRVSERELTNTPQTQRLRKAILEDACDICRSIVDLNATHPSALRRNAAATQSLAILHAELGNIENAIETFRQAADLWSEWIARFPNNTSLIDSRNRLADVYHNLGVLYQQVGQSQLSVSNKQRAIEIRRQLLKSDEGQADSELRLSFAKSLTMLAATHKDFGQITEATERLNEAINELESLTSEEPSNGDFHIYLGWALGHQATIQTDLSNNLSANKLNARALKIIEKWTPHAKDVRWANQQLADALCHRSEDVGVKDPVYANQLLDRSINISQTLIRDFPETPDYSQNLAEALGVKGQLHIDLGEFTKAVEAFSQSIEIVRKLNATHYAQIDSLARMAIDLNGLATAYARSGDYEASEQAMSECIETTNRLVAKAPKVVFYRYSLAMYLINLAVKMKSAGQIEKSISLCKKSIDVASRLVEERAENQKFRVLLIMAHGQLAANYLTKQQFETSKQEILTVLPMAKKLSNQNPTLQGLEEQIILLEGNLAACHAAMSEFPEARQAFLRTADYFLKKIKQNPNAPAYRLNLAGTYTNLGFVEKELKQYTAAEEFFKKSNACLEALPKRMSRNRLVVSRILDNLHELSEVCKREERIKQAQQYLATMLDLARETQNSEGELKALEDLCYLYFDIGKYAESINWFERLDKMLVAMKGPDGLKTLSKQHDYALALIRTGRNDEAFERFEVIVSRRSKIRTQQPENWENTTLLGAAHTNLGTLRIQRDESTRPEEHFQLAIQLLTESLENGDYKLTKKFLYTTHLSYGQLLQDDKNTDSAINSYLKAVEVAPGKVQRANARLKLGICLIDTNNWTQAVGTLEKAAVDNPPDSHVNFHLARAHASMGSKKEALVALTRAIDEGFNDVQEIENDKYLAVLANNSQYQKIIERLKSD